MSLQLTHVKMTHRDDNDELEMALRVKRVEQQMEQLPAQWKQFAGNPMYMSVYGTKINTFRDNPELRPTRAYVQSALQALKQQLAAENVRLSDAEMEEIIRQEWQTDMTRSVVEARLNRHDSKDGPVVRRSSNGVVYVSAQPAPGEPFVLDAIATPSRRKK